MLYQAQAAVATEPWLAIAPGAFSLMTTVSVSLIGDRLAGVGRSELPGPSKLGPLLNYRSLIARGHTNASRPSAGIRSSRPHDVERVVHHVRVKGNPAEVIESLRLVEIDGVPCFVDVENPSVELDRRAIRGRASKVTLL